LLDASFLVHLLMSCHLNEDFKTSIGVFSFEGFLFSSIIMGIFEIFFPVVKSMFPPSLLSLAAALTRTRFPA